MAFSSPARSARTSPTCASWSVAPRPPGPNPNPLSSLALTRPTPHKASLAILCCVLSSESAAADAHSRRRRCQFFPPICASFMYFVGHMLNIPLQGFDSFTRSLPSLWPLPRAAAGRAVIPHWTHSTLRATARLLSLSASVTPQYFLVPL